MPRSYDSLCDEMYSKSTGEITLVQKVVVALATVCMVVVYLAAVYCFAVGKSPYAVAIIFFWWVVSSTVYLTIIGDRTIFYDKRRRLRPWSEIVKRLVITTLYAMIVFERVVRAHFVWRNKLNKEIHRYD